GSPPDREHLDRGVTGQAVTEELLQPRDQLRVAPEDRENELLPLWTPRVGRERRRAALAHQERGAVLKQLPGRQVNDAVDAIEQPRVGVEVGRGDGQLGLARRQPRYREDPPGVALRLERPRQGALSFLDRVGGAALTRLVDGGRGLREHPPADEL